MNTRALTIRAGTGCLAKVSFRAAVARINRKLNSNEQVLRKARGRGKVFLSVGQHYVIDRRLNCMIETNVDVEELARRLDCLSAQDTLQPEGVVP
jgi:hypothetical protein